MKFGQRLQELRKARGMSQTAVAQAMSMDNATLSKMETGRGYHHNPARETVQGFGKVLKLSVQESDDLHVLAGRVPEDVETALLSEPRLIVLVRQRSAVRPRGNGRRR
jgi:transcriptional regulator with XRE-family HTH domain